MDTPALVIAVGLMTGLLVVYVVRLGGQVRRLERRVDQISPQIPSGRRNDSPNHVPPTPLQASAASNVGLSAEGELLVRQALRDGEKIEAVKFVRDETGMGLKEAKRYVESLGRF